MLLIFIGLIIDIFIICKCYKKWKFLLHNIQNENILKYYLIIGVLGIFIILLGILGCKIKNNINNELKSPPYGVDYQRELSTYCIIGTNKKIKNRAKRFTNYSEWKKHILDEYQGIKNLENAYHYFVRKKRYSEVRKELISFLIVPLELTVIASSFAVEVNFVVIIILCITVGVMVMREYCDCSDEINFINDFMTILFPKQRNGV